MRQGELRALCTSCGLDVADEIMQQVERLHPRTVIGEGKVEEIAQRLSEEAVDLVVFERALTGSQMRNLANALDCKVLDRNDVILEIFARRARTKKAKLQVELAQQAYRLPRLAGLGKSLSGQGAGVGTRGPGEQKLELDRRSVERRIAQLKKQLRTLEKQEETAAKRRAESALPVVSLIGYTNAGKSTIRNALARRYGTNLRKVYADDRLFATLEVSVRRIEPPSGAPFLLADTIGFLRDLPEKLQDAFQSTVEEMRRSNLLVFILDSAGLEVEEQIRSVKQILSEQEVTVPLLYVMNKIDLGAQHPVTPPAETLYVSAHNKDDMARLCDTIARHPALKRENSRFYTKINSKAEMGKECDSL